MADSKRIIERLKAAVSGKPEAEVELLPFEFSAEIDDSDEQDLDHVANVYPARADLPRDPGPDQQRLEAWQEKCRILISGVSIHVGIKYLDARGRQTSRRVLVNKIFKSDDGLRYLCGYCALRARYRNFREDRIEEIVELETGQVHAPAGAFFDRYGIFGSPVLEQLQVIIHILGYLARVDRSFVDEEKTIISWVVGQYCDGRQKELVEEYGFSHRVTRKDYLNEVAKLVCMDPGVAELVVKKAEELIGVDGKVTRTEQDFFDILRKNL